jgi:hypothetical protein
MTCKNDKSRRVGFQVVKVGIDYSVFYSETAIYIEKGFEMGNEVMMPGQEEIGRELGVNELVPMTVYVLTKPGRPAATMWFWGRANESVMFYAGVSKTALFLDLREDGSMADDSGIQIKVYEYLGKID